MDESQSLTSLSLRCRRLPYQLLDFPPACRRRQLCSPPTRFRVAIPALLLGCFDFLSFFQINMLDPALPIQNVILLDHV
jgi:hypothetical protein